MNVFSSMKIQSISNLISKSYRKTSKEIKRKRVCLKNWKSINFAIKQTIMNKNIFSVFESVFYHHFPALLYFVNQIQLGLNLNTFSSCMRRLTILWKYLIKIIEKIVMIFLFYSSSSHLQANDIRKKNFKIKFIDCWL